MKLYINIFLLFLLLNTLNAQDKVNINEYGTYIVQNGITKRINTQYEVWGSFFWDKYLILQGESIIGCCIYNMETEAISDWIWGTVVQVEKGEEPIFYFSISWPYGPDEGYWKYTYTSDMLVLKSKVKLQENPFLSELQKIKMSSFLYYGNKYSQKTIEEVIDKRLYRYTGENYYLDINYGPNIDITGRYLDYPISGGIENIFILPIHKVKPYK